MLSLLFNKNIVFSNRIRELSKWIRWLENRNHLKYAPVETKPYLSSLGDSRFS